MRKIPSVFQRNYDTDRLIRDEVVPGCEWVLAGEGVATRKWDGTAVMVRGGRLFKRYDAKQGKTPPPGFEPCQAPDEKTGHWPGWVPVNPETNKEPHFADALMLLANLNIADGTHELCGPRVNGNPEGFNGHCLMQHGHGIYYDFPRTFAEMRARLEITEIEGVVFHHPDGRMAKVKRKDFGFKWPAHTTKDTDQ
jgi:hypothetical protein